MVLDLVYASVIAPRRPFLEKVGAAAAAGFTGITLSSSDYLAARGSGLGDADLAAAIRDARIAVTTAGSATRFLLGKSDEEEELALDLCEHFGAPGLTCTPSNAPFLGIEAATEAFGAVCDRAARRGATCRLEFFPWTGLRDVHTAWEIVRRADRPNGGVLVDIWHLHRGGGCADDVRVVAPEKIIGVQLSDATLVPREPDLFADTFNRLLPGEGELDVVGFIRTLDDMGVTVAFEGEPINPRWDELPASASASALYSSLVTVVTEARRQP